MISIVKLLNLNLCLSSYNIVNNSLLIEQIININYLIEKEIKLIDII